MSDIPADLKYTKSHEWVRIEDDIATVGITDHAQHLLGDMVFIELPEIGREVTVGEECAVVESVKSASDVYSPLNGEIIEVNEALGDTPEIVNQSAFDDGWLFKVKLADDSGADDMLDADAYAAVVAEDE
jgi:glycine cleavage system H protein